MRKQATALSCLLAFVFAAAMGGVCPHCLFCAERVHGGPSTPEEEAHHVAARCEHQKETRAENHAAASKTDGSACPCCFPAPAQPDLVRAVAPPDFQLLAVGAWTGSASSMPLIGEAAAGWPQGVHEPPSHPLYLQFCRLTL